MRGSIKKNTGKKGTTWTIIYDVPTPDGSRKQKKETFKKQSEAEKRLREALTQIDTGNFTDPGKLTLAKYLEKWFETHSKTLSPYTIVRYRSVIDKNINPAIGNIPLKKLTTLNIQSFLNALDGTYAANTIKSIKQILNSALNQALEWDMISKNPTKNTKTPKNKSTQKEILSVKSIPDMLETFKETNFYGPVYIALYTGMRLGEILGLKWEEVDLDKKIIRVKQQLIHTKEHGFAFKEPKSAKSKRTINISSDVVKFLKEQKKRLKEMKLKSGPEWTENNLVFCQDNGQPYRPNYIANAFWQKSKQAGYDISFHSLRHTHASLLLKAGIPPKVVSERLGHSSIAITMDIYSHIIPGMQEEAAEKLEQLLARD